MERSKRESKYMGVSKGQWKYEDFNSSGEGTSSAYPPEKTGWHDQDEPTSTPQPHRLTHDPVPSPLASHHSSSYLDISRLITMPPPYPRHYPAVNNNHPQLAHIRASVRLLSELEEVDAAKDAFSSASVKRRDEFDQGVAERRRSMSNTLQKDIGSGKIGYSEAAAIEAGSKEHEKEKKKELEKSEYERFQTDVVVPLNELLMGRVAKATDLFDDTSRQLFDNDENDADMPHEEGDDRPELLEKLTLLKWIFETRETLHRTIYDLLSDRNYRYSQVVMTPYRLSGNTDKLQSAESFFKKDAQTREYSFANEVLDRTREFRSVVDEAVQRGVAIQLSAFWDIAPPLSELLESVPGGLEGFSVHIPASEHDENPAYREHPLQYLFGLLLHAEKSTYQYIESHTNLLCLLHQIKEAVVMAKGRVLETPAPDGAELTEEERQERATKLRDGETARLTTDLQDKVRVVEDQWENSLGGSMRDVKKRTKEWLLSTDGWDEALEVEAA